MKITRRQLRHLIREGIFDKRKDDNPSSSKKSVKEQMQDLVDEDPDKRALGEVDLENNYYGRKDLAKPATIRDAQRKLGIPPTGAHSSADHKTLQIMTCPETGMMYSVVEKL